MKINLLRKYKIVQSDITKISGAIGLTILTNTNFNKKIYLFFDDHSNKIYCNGNINFLDQIYKKLEIKYSNLIFLLEEPMVSSNTKIINLWNDSTHITNFRKHYTESINKCSKEKICKTFPVDIRLCLFDVSIEEMIMNVDNLSYFDNLEYSTPNYFKNIFFLFNLISLKDFIQLSKLYDLNSNSLNSTVDLSSLSDMINNLIWLKEVFEIFKDSTYYIKLKKSIEILLIKYILPNKKVLIKDFIKTISNLDYTLDIGFPYTTSFLKYNILDLYDHIINGIMEFYAVILANYLENNMVLINCGFYHAINIKYILTNFYNYQIIYDTGITSLQQIESDIPYTNCIEIDNKYL